MRKTLQFATVIEAPREVVWETMLAPETYRQWAAAFGEGSYFEGSWDEGREIRFLAPGGSGMLAVIAESRRPAFVSIKHLGFIKDGVEDTESPEVRAWAPMHENYTLADAGAGSTEVQVELDSVAEMDAFMKETWPKALARLKAIAEGGSRTGK